ncbi:AMP-binding protein [Desulfoscipio sp. XC116]|uniref:AMP-binding protein n=1 Tax=Desulfoscipio sp. XC116 TaxID=3144975 RepID=UPI00325B3C0E
MNIDSIERLVKSEGEFAAKRLEKWAEVIPDKTFFFYGEENRHISFKEFNQLTNSIAHNLISIGISKGDRVSVFLKNPVATTLTMFSIWKVGAVYCPVNTSYMGKLLAYQINDIKSKALITERNMVSLVNDIKDDIENLLVVVYNPQKDEHDYNSETAKIKLVKKFKEILFESLLLGKTANLETNLTFKDIANIIYTSGTTGPAKGVVQSHRYVNTYIAFWRNFTNQEDVIYSDIPLYHIGGAFQNIVRAAWVGCTVAVWDKFSPNEFWNRIKLCGATNAILLDVMIPWLLNAKETPNDRINTLNKVYMQPLPMHHNAIARRFGFDFVIAGYGQTEAGNGFAGIIEELDEDEGTPHELYNGYSHEEIRAIGRKINATIVQGEQEFKKGFMGKPSFYLQAVVLNDNDEECQPKQVGQICFRSYLPYTIIDEYYGKPEATVKKFKNFWFHSGDAGFVDENGYFYFLDRISGCIRRRGENISSYQIEDIINGHPSVDCCAAFPISAKEGEEDDIVVFIVSRKGEDLEEKNLVQWVKGKMPKFMWPQYVRFVNDLPRTPTNKILKFKLREMILKELDAKDHGLQNKN